MKFDFLRTIFSLQFFLYLARRREGILLLIGIRCWVRSSKFCPLDFQLCATSVHFLCRGLQGRGTTSLVSFIFTLTSRSPLLSSMIFFSLYLARSPVFSHLSASLQGLHTIRALRVQEKFCEEFDNHQNLHTESWFLFLSSSRWLAVRLDWMCAIFITVVSFACVFLAKGLFRTWSYPWFDCYITCSQTCT